MKKKNIIFILMLVVSAMLCACNVDKNDKINTTEATESVVEESTEAIVQEEKTDDDIQTDVVVDESKDHKQMTLDMIALLEEDAELKSMMEKSIAKAAEINPDKNTNPAQNLEEFYDFLDWANTCQPWNVLKDAKYPTLYEHIDQSVDYFWFLVDQPLEELEDKGYYYPTLQYHEPIASWCKKYANAWGDFLDTEDSWSDEYYDYICSDDRFAMKSGLYAMENEWNTFNEWFSRKLADPEASRPIDNAEVVAPADSKPQGVWEVDENGNFKQHEGVVLKSKNFNSIPEIIGEDSEYENDFAGGTLTHTFLDVNDYHRYHFPVSGTIKEVRKIDATNAAGGITTWNDETGKYVLEDAIPGWQSVETRDCLIVDTKDYGLVAILPIGMSQICSCNWEDTVVVGAEVKKGDPMGYFLFGGSDIVMIFQDCVEFEMLAEPDGLDGYNHINMGQAYGKLVKKN